MKSREEKAAYHLAYRARNRENIAVSRRGQYARKAKEVATYGRKYYLQNREKIRVQKHEHYLRNKREKAAYDRKYRYGLTGAQLDGMLEQQHGRCGVCRTPFRKTPNVDHDHISGEVRGLLCACCNRGLGYFKDDLTLLGAAMEYLMGCQ